MKRFKLYNFEGATYTLDTENWQMTVWDDEEHDEFGIGDPKLVAKVITLGEEVERM